MTYVSRRARVTLPRWPNEFDPEFLFRVSRRCDGRLKRHSSCHDLRAWINDNCIKNEYLLELMSDGEVELKPPLELYGRFIPVPILFKLLQSSRSENGPGDIDWEKIARENESGGRVREKDRKASALGPDHGEKDKKASAIGPDHGEKDKKASAVGPEQGEKGKKASAVGPEQGEKGKKASAIGPEQGEKGKKGSALGPAYGEKDNKRSETRYPFEDPGKLRSSGVSFEEAEISKGPGGMRAKSKRGRSISPEESVKIEPRSFYDDEPSGRGVGQESGAEATGYPSYKAAQRKWDPYEKTEYYTPGLATKDSFIDRVCPPCPTEDSFIDRVCPPCTSPTQTTMVMDDEYENTKRKPVSHKSATQTTVVMDDEYENTRRKPIPQKSAMQTTIVMDDEYENTRRKPTSQKSAMQTPIVMDDEYENTRRKPIHQKSAMQTTIAMDDEYENTSRKPISHKSGSEGSLARVLWEKDMIEKNLFKSTCLLTKAVGKLEKIDNIIQVANDERERMRKGEIQEAFRKPTINSIDIQGKSNTDSGSSWGVKYRVRSLGEKERQDTLKCGEILRQISGLREKLKKNQECQQRVNEEITMSQREAESGASPHMTDLNSDGETQLRKLQRKLEKLINHRGKLLSDMCQALTQLNNLKRSRNSRMDMRQRSRSGENRNSTFRQVFYCPCRNCPSSESERAHNSDSGSSNNNQFRRPCFNRDDDKSYYYTSTDNLDSGQQNLNDTSRTKANALSGAYASNGGFYKDSRQEELRKSILRYCCPDPPCKEDPDPDLDASERYIPSGQHSPNRGALANNPTLRPSTSPTTKREKWDASEEPRYVSYGTSPRETPERRVKSETTMKEIEKTLRNYEQRLSDMDGLEYKVEEWKRKLLEACKWKRNASKAEAQMKREQDNERNRASLEINGLFSQNYELKKQVRQLMDKSKEQAKKIQNMKSGILKARELESETEELKKELSEYRNSYEHQRKCISKWESVVALQRKEIENLMNHIRKLTTEKKEQVTICCQDKRLIQRTRSCSPVTFVDCQACRPQESYNLRSDEENGSCCCQDFRQSDSRRSQLRFFDKNYYSSLNGREDWCT